MSDETAKMLARAEAEMHGDGGWIERATLAEDRLLAASAASMGYRQRAERAEARTREIEALAQRLAAALDLTLHDAHPTYGSTALWHGGIGGQAITSHCSIINGPPPGGEWAEHDLPSKPLREFLDVHPFDLAAAKESLKAELLEMLR